MLGPLARGPLLRRQMSNGALAGTIVGVAIGALLLALCIYPVVVCQIKRRRRPRTPRPDAEAGGGADSNGPQVAGLGYHRRLSSSDSLKRNGELPRGVVPAAATSKELGGPGQATAHAAQAHAAPWQLVSTGPDAITSDGSRAVAQPFAGDYSLQSQCAPLPFYVGEYMPVSDVRDDHTGVLRGTSADYYSASIPSEAFGMVSTPVDEPAVVPRTSRSSSFRHNVRNLFWRTSGQDRSTGSYGSGAGAGAGLATSYGASVPQQITKHQNLTESPTSLSPKLPAPETSASPPSAEPPPRPETSLKTLPSPPSYPAPGTVNPMDIMPASTETEVWHRTEHELHASSHLLATAVSVPPGHQSTDGDYAKQDSASSQALETPSTVVPPRTVLTAESPYAAGEPEHVVQDVPEDDTAAVPAEDHGPGSTVPSSYNTPSTQLDSPTPESLIGSDFRHSVSPQFVVSSVKPGAFPCDEPGCHQAFDHLHKLKHHQRYHNKEHRCPYADCDKGFGTKTHLQRHINDRHERKKTFHCSVQGCDYSWTGGKGFPRKDNWKRHMTHFHKIDQANLPEPVEVDQEMGGV